MQPFIIKDFTLSFPAQKSKGHQVIAKNPSVCLKSYPGEGKPAWLFTDEIMAE